MASILGVSVTLAVASPGSAQPPPTDPPAMPSWVASEGRTLPNPRYDASQTDWTRRDVSARLSPEALLGVSSLTAVPSTTGLVAVRNAGGRPQVVRVKASGAAALRAAVVKLQSDKSVLAVAVDRKRKVISTTGASSSRTAAPYCDGRTTDPTQWDYTALGMSDVVASGATGSGAVVAVVDSGVNGNTPDLRGNVLSGTDYVSNGNGWNDQVGHGTHVAGTIAALRNGTGITGVAPSAKILPVRVADANGEAYDSATAAGIEYAAAHGAHVINLSLAGEYDSVIQTVVKYAMSRNIAVVAASGNERLEGNPVRYPAAYPGVLAVGATDQNSAPTYFTESHSYVRIAAPGMDITSTFPVGTTATTGLCSMAGTSMASPHVAGIAALMYQVSGHRVRGAQAIAILVGTTTFAGSAGYDTTTGYGIVNPGQAVAKARCVAAVTCSIPLPNVQDYAAQRWVQRCSITLSGAGPATTTLLSWPSLVARGTKTPAELLYPLTGSTYYNQKAVQTYLYSAVRRTGPSSSVNYYASWLAKGKTQQQVYATLLGSTEAYKRAGSTNAKWVAMAYKEATGYPASATLVKAYTTQLARGASRGTVAYRMVTTMAGLNRLVDMQYTRFLGHLPTATTRTTWAKRFAAGTSVRSLSATLVGSAEYRNRF